MGVLLDPNGAPLAGALVYVEGYGAAVTDADGLYRFSGISPGEVVILTFRKTGYEFEPPELSLEAGQTAPAPESQVAAVRPEDCSERDMLESLVGYIEAGVSLKELGAAAAGDLERLRGLSAAEQRRTALVAAVFRRFLTAAGELPDEVYSCPASRGCRRSALAARKAQAVKALGRLRDAVIKTSLGFKKAKSGRSLRKSDALRSRRLYAAGARALRKFPKATDICGGG